ncbi:MAG TPA: hypothetical protein QGF58_15415 [Myxococcota bacterium]|nr:hypothetical protein [Myxococcota bacterium]
MRRLILSSLLVSLAAASSVAVAQGRYVIFEEEKIVGEIQLPSVQIFITRQNLNTDYDLKLEESFVPKIVESADKQPF